MNSSRVLTATKMGDKDGKRRARSGVKCKADTIGGRPTRGRLEMDGQQGMTDECRINTPPIGDLPAKFAASHRRMDTTSSRHTGKHTQTPTHAPTHTHTES